MALCFLALADVSHPDEWKNAIICGQVAYFWPFPPSFLTLPIPAS